MKTVSKAAGLAVAGALALAQWPQRSRLRRVPTTEASRPRLSSYEDSGPTYEAPGTAYEEPSAPEPEPYFPNRSRRSCLPMRRSRGCGPEPTVHPP